MKTMFREIQRLLGPVVLVVCWFALDSVTRLQGQQLKQEMDRSQQPVFGTFWLQSFQHGNRISPPFPFDPYGGVLPVYQVKGRPGQYVVADQPEDYQQLRLIEKSRASALSSLAADGASMLAFGEASSSPSAMLLSEPETLLFDTTESSSTGALPSWRDVRANPVPAGYAFGILITTNCPFEITRIEVEVSFENLESLPDTEIETAFFRGTKQFKHALFLTPEHAFSDVEGTLVKTLTDLGNGRWKLTLELPTYAWGTSRVLTIRTMPNSNGTMAKMSLFTTTQAVDGVVAYTSDNANNLVQVALPKMKVWRRMLSETRAVSLEVFSSDIELTRLPGYQMGSSADLNMPWDWQTDWTHNLRTVVDTRQGAGFFLTRPDPTE